MQVEEEIKKFIKKQFRVETLDNSTNIFELGYVNSLFFVQLIMFLENEFNITIEPGEIDVQQFTTVEKILDFVENKKVMT